MRTGLFWFTNDLRLHDNPALVRACMSVDRLVCLFNFEYSWSQHAQRMQQCPGKHRQRFIEQSVADLADNLAALGQVLVIRHGSHLDALTECLERFQPTDVFQSVQHGFYENEVWHRQQKAHSSCRFHRVSGYTLFDSASLPFTIENMPDGFGAFRRALEVQRPVAPLQSLTYLPPPPRAALDDANVGASQSPEQKSEQKPESESSPMLGGETAALQHLATFFNSEFPARYKQTRNALDGWTNSCKFSPWLSTGCLSVRKVISALNTYEKERVANDSTYWIYFELLWREYFQWYALRHGARLFRFTGVSGRRPLTSFYPARLMKWRSGKTPYPIVNACMNELAATGYLSNRGRQIVASCLIHELGLDWRYGAAYFEQQLIDYDVATNWGNWQYLAGVGAATVTHRHFNLEKQVRQFDPDGRYVRQWGGETGASAQLDHVDGSDWPLA